MGSELKWQYSKGKGEELKKFIQNSINPIIETDIKDKKVSMSQLYNNGTVSGYKWGNYGKDVAESIFLRSLNQKDTEYFLRLLLQQTDDKNLFDVSLENIDWEKPIFLEPLEKKF